VKGHHKKSMSDGGFEKSGEAVSDQQMKVYNMFMNVKPPEDFVKRILRNRKDTADELFESIANLDFKDDTHDSSKQEDYAIKNYPASKLSRNGSAKDLIDDAPFQNSGSKSGGIFFNESLTLSEIEKLETAPNNPKDVNQISPVYFVNSPPPGITPTSRYPQKSYTYSDMTQPVQN
jgi:hypothetical protein